MRTILLFRRFEWLHWSCLRNQFREREYISGMGPCSRAFSSISVDQLIPFSITIKVTLLLFLSLLLLLPLLFRLICDWYPAQAFRDLQCCNGLSPSGQMKLAQRSVKKHALLVFHFISYPLRCLPLNFFDSNLLMSQINHHKKDPPTITSQVKKAKQLCHDRSLSLLG